ncbi:MAG: D-alanyl-D-alanine carboxypeptidase/D-alanyl-D-alanine-endopeptidase [Pseudomonadota bacterium]
MRRLVAMVFLSALLLPAAAQAEKAGSENLPEPVAQALKRHGLPTRGLSVYVREIGQPSPLLAVAAEQPRHPASTIKVLTTLAGLEELGPAYRWKTEAYTTAPVRNGRLEGDLYLKGYGDPYLVMEYFWRFLRGLRAAGIEEIAGDLVLDQSYFAREPGEFDGQTLRAYNVLPNALLVNFQAVNFRFIPQPGASRVHIFADPLPANLEVVNRVTLSQAPCRGWAHNLGLKLQHQGNDTKVIFSGTYEADCGDNELFRVVSEPAPYTLGMFKMLWSELGGRFAGGVREGRAPEKARLLHSVDSPPLAGIIRAINKYSNHVRTRQLVLTMGAEKAGPPGTTEGGIQVVRDWLKRRGLNFPELKLENGAGLSREESISARHLGEVLLAGWQSPYMPEFISSFPISAMDGTLRRRFSGTDMEGQLHLKTGSLNDVRTLAGYVLDQQGRRLIVVCLHNHAQADTAAGEAVQKALLEWVYRRP